MGHGEIRPPVICLLAPEHWNPAGVQLGFYFLLFFFLIFLHVVRYSTALSWHEYGSPIYFSRWTSEAVMTLLPDILILWFGSFPNQCLSVSMNEVAATRISGMSNLSAWEPLWFSQHGESIDPWTAAVETNVKMATDGVEVTAFKCPFLPAFIAAGWGYCTFRGLWSVCGTTFGRLDCPCGWRRVVPVESSRGRARSAVCIYCSLMSNISITWYRSSFF